MSPYQFISLYPYYLGTLLWMFHTQSLWNPLHIAMFPFTGSCAGQLRVVYVMLHLLQFRMSAVVLDILFPSLVIEL